MRRLKSATAAEHLLEIVTPRTNAARLTSAEHLFGALGAGTVGEATPVSLEIVGDAERRRFLVRTSSSTELRQVARQLGSAYPQSVLRPFDASTVPTGDPAQLGTDEQVVAVVLQLRRGEYLPLRTFEDREVDTSGVSIQADPLLGILGAMMGVPDGWRAMAQLVVVAPAAPGWARDYQRLALERPADQDRRADTGPSPVGPLALLGAIGLYQVGVLVSAAWARGDWLGSLALAGGTLAVIVGSILAVRWLRRRELVDPRLVQVKLGRDACQVELRLGVFAPALADPDEVQARLDQLASAYRPYTLAAGNGLRPRSIRAEAPDLRILARLQRPNLLNVRELAGLWHLPQAGDDVALVERTTARRRLPLPATVGPASAGAACRIGVSAHQGQTIPVYLPPGLLNRHLLAVAKTRRGKSSLLLRIVQHLMHTSSSRMGDRTDGARQRCLVLVDPHHDLAASALALVPRHRQADVVYLDVSNRRRPFGINLLDVGLGWDRDQATANALRIFRREFDGFWGPRMEDAFRFAVLALFEANQSLCAEDPRHGRSAQHTVLDVPAVLERHGFRRQVLKRTSDPVIRHWFEGYFETLDPRLRMEVINPVQTKVHKYLGSQVARQIVGQPRSTVDFRQLVAEGKLVIVNLNAFDVGEDVAALVGGTLLNLAARAISAQAVLPAESRRAVTLVVDEFHSLPGADYEQILGELAKYGANLLLASQTLSRLDHLTDSQRTRDLRAAVFSNLDGLFAFHCSAEDAAYLAEELGGGLDAQDLLELGHYQCYARVSDARTGERLPAFSVQLAPPPHDDRQLATTLARLSAESYGRDALDVELDLQGALERIRGPRRSSDADETNAQSGPPSPAPANSGTSAPAGVIAGAELPK